MIPVSRDVGGAQAGVAAGPGDHGVAAKTQRIADRAQQIAVVAGKQGVDEAAAGVVEPGHRGVVGHVPAGDDVGLGKCRRLEGLAGDDRCPAGLCEATRRRIDGPRVGYDDDDRIRQPGLRKHPVVGQMNVSHRGHQVPG